MCESAKFLFLALADNIRVNAEHLTYAREEYDKIFGYRDLEIDLCARNRNKIREIFLSASNLLQQTPDWLNVKSYVILVELHQKHKRLSGDKFTEEDMPKLADEIYKCILKVSPLATKPSGKQTRELRRKSHKQYLKDVKAGRCPRKGCVNAKTCFKQEEGI